MDQADQAFEERLAELRSNQMLWEHGACVAYLSTTRERPNWAEWQFFRGSHNECQPMICTFTSGPGVEDSSAGCHLTAIN